MVTLSIRKSTVIQTVTTRKTAVIQRQPATDEQQSHDYRTVTARLPHGNYPATTRNPPSLRSLQEGVTTVPGGMNA